MTNKKGTNKKSGFSLAPITLSEPVKATDGFTNLVEASDNRAETVEPAHEQGSEAAKNENAKKSAKSGSGQKKSSAKAGESETSENSTGEFNLTEAELLRILDADSPDEIYELTDVLRASSLKLYATLVELADSRGRARVKNHELMSKAGIKGIATLYKQERWLIDLKLLEKKAKPGPHDGSSYVVHKLETLPLPNEIYEKFNRFLAERNG